MSDTKKRKREDGLEKIPIEQWKFEAEKRDHSKRLKKRRDARANANRRKGGDWK